MSDRHAHLFLTGLGEPATLTPEELDSKWGRFIRTTAEQIIEGRYKEATRMITPQDADYSIIVRIHKQESIASRVGEYERDILTPVQARTLLRYLPRLMWQVFRDAVRLIRRRRKMRSMHGIGYQDDSGDTTLRISLNLFREDY